MSYRRKKRNEPEELSFWQSYSDMMAALLLVFVLIIATAKFSYDKKTEESAKLQIELEEKEADVERLRLELEQKEDTLKEKEKTLYSQQEQLDRILGVRKDLVEKLKKEFGNKNLGMTIDSETGAITFKSSILFSTNSSNLNTAGISFLNEFFPKYFDVVLNEEFAPFISEVLIEGHADNQGTFIYNLKLSQERAYSVAKYCLENSNHMFSDEDMPAIQKLVVVNGRSYNDLIYYENGKVDQEASRRVEIKFRLTEEEMIKEMAKILENG